MNLTATFLASSIFLLVSCSDISYDEKDIYGSWNYKSHSVKENIESTMVCIANFEDSRVLLINCSHKLRGAYVSATYKSEFESEWFFQGGSYFEKSTHKRLISINGTKELVEYIKRDFRSANSSEWLEWKIIKLDSDDFIIQTKDDEDSIVRMELQKFSNKRFQTTPQ